MNPHNPRETSMHDRHGSPGSTTRFHPARRAAWYGVLSVILLSMGICAAGLTFPIAAGFGVYTVYLLRDVPPAPDGSDAEAWRQVAEATGWTSMVIGLGSLAILGTTAALYAGALGAGLGPP